MNTELAEAIKTESYGEVREILQFMLEECSLAEAPSAAELMLWRDTLAARGGKFTALAQECQTLLDTLP